MCGIFAYSDQADRTNQADQNKITQVASQVRQGLKNLDYRGYDSWGIVATNGKKLDFIKQVGVIPDSLPKKLLGKVALGHTRWATHGGVTKTNAHPHLASDNSFALVHNGIVENMAELKQDLVKKGYRFKSETDSEVIVGLIESSTASSLEMRLIQAVKQLVGRNTIAILTQSGDLLAVKQGSPLVVGRQKARYFLSSDTLSFAGQADEFLVMEDGCLVKIGRRGVTLKNIKTGQKLSPRWQVLKLQSEQTKLKEKHYMIQEIKQTPQAIKALLNQPVDQYRQLAKAIQSADSVFTIGSGTAGLAASQIAYYLRQYAGILATSLIGAESSSYINFFGPKSLIIAPSQSGETADVLEVLEVAKKQGATLVSQVNMPGSSMSRISDIAFLAEAGPEKCVMSTKIFSSQISWGYLVAKTVAGEAKVARTNLSRAAVQLDQLLGDNSWLRKLKKLADALLEVDDIYLMGTGDLLAIVSEGMVKLIEGTYKHAHALPAGDLKHYVITLMEPAVPVLVATPDVSQSAQLINNAATEVKARGATVIAIGPTQLAVADQWIDVPKLGELQALANILPLQLLSYYLADKLGRPVDKPRNIAKSVTVK